MKGIILGSDFIEKDNSVKILETNTNTTFFNEGSEFLDYDPLFNVFIQNNITELHFIYTVGDSYLPTNDPVFVFEEILKEKCNQNNIQYFAYTVPENSVTVPYIEDAPNKFILRQAFDTTALVDETYCADKFEFLKLLENSSLTPKSYFNDPTLGSNELLEITDNGSDVPNILVKYRYPNYDGKEYPQIYNLTSNEQLAELKAGLEEGYIIQEFLYDQVNLVQNRWSVIRSIDIIYGSELDVVSLGGYRTTTALPIDYYGNEFFSGTRKYNQKTRYKFINKQNGNFYDVTYHVDNDSNIIMSDGTTRTLNNVAVNDTLKSLQFTDLNGIGSSHENNLQSWDGTFNKTVETLTDVDTTAVSIHSSDIKALFIKVTLENGTTWSDSPYSIFYFEEKDIESTRWDLLNKMVVGDKFIIRNKVTGELSKLAITNLEIEYMEKTVYELDVEPSDVFLSDLGNDLYAIMHNNCSGCGDPWGGFCGNWLCYPYCGFCGGGSPVEK